MTKHKVADRLMYNRLKTTSAFRWRTKWHLSQRTKNIKAIVTHISLFKKCEYQSNIP